MAAAARAEGPYVYQGGTLDLDLSDYGDFNAVPHAEDEDPDFLFRQQYGMEGDAGPAIYLPSLGQSFGLAAGQGFFTNSENPQLSETDQGRVITSKLWVDDPNDLGEPPFAALLEITQTFVLSNTNQTLSVEYAIRNVSGAPLRMRPYLLGTPYLLNRSQFEVEENTIRSTFSKAPSPALSMSSTKANRELTVISTGSAKPDSAQVFGYDLDGNNAGLERIFTTALTPGTAFTGAFDTSQQTDPAFGMTWNDWMTSAGLAAGQTARIAATFSFNRSSQSGSGSSVGGVPIGGTVLIKLPNGTFSELKPGDEIPSGSTVDTTNGTVQLSTQGPGGSAQTAAFRGGVFRLLRTSSSAFTTLKLEGRLSCGRISQRSSRGISRRRGGGRSLWGSGKGKFRTQGKRGSGSVRGTTWQVTDQCDGSTTIQSLRGASQGIVDAKDFGKPGKRIALKPGQSYTAKPGK